MQFVRIILWCVVTCFVFDVKAQYKLCRNMALSLSCKMFVGILGYQVG